VRGTQPEFARQIPRGVIKAPVASAEPHGMESDDTPVLCLTCPRCRTTFPSALRVGPEVFRRMTARPTVERCRSCGHAGRYKRSDYFFDVPQSA
jgi:hypothetical protein